MDFQQELIAEYDREAADPQDSLRPSRRTRTSTYKPHPKSMALGRLAGHI